MIVESVLQAVNVVNAVVAGRAWMAIARGGVRNIGRALAWLGVVVCCMALRQPAANNHAYRHAHSRKKQDRKNSLAASA